MRLHKKTKWTMHICTKEPQKVLEQRQRKVATTFALVTPPPCSPPPIPVLVGGRAQYAWWQPPLPHLTLTHCHTGAYTIIAAAHTTTTLPQTYTTTMVVVHNNTEQWWHTHHNGPPTLLILWPLRQIFHLVIILPHIIILSYYHIQYFVLFSDNLMSPVNIYFSLSLSLHSTRKEIQLKFCYCWSLGSWRLLAKID